MTAAGHARRRCAAALNSLHSICYFAPDLDDELARYGVVDPMAAYLAARAAPMGATDAGPVIAAFNAFAPGLVGRHLPAVWSVVTPAQSIAARLRSSDTVLRRVLGELLLGSDDVLEAAELAACATEACGRAGRTMYSANADLSRPDEPHLLLWHAATLLREHRGDGHVAVLLHSELSGLDALVLDCASPAGMAAELVMSKRGWTTADWSSAQARLRARGLMDLAGALTESGLQLRTDLEAETDRLDRSPYDWLGQPAVARLTEIVERLVRTAAGNGAFPAVLHDFFVAAELAPVPVTGESR